MAKLEIDYSLPYDEAKKKYGRNGYFMSEDQYNFNKAAAEKQAKMNAGTGNWWEHAGESDKVLQEATGKENPTKEDVQKSIQGIIDNPYPSIGGAYGNKGDDHINHPNEADTADLVKVQQAREKLFGQKDSYTPEEIEAAKNEAGITKNVPGSTSANNALTDSVSEAVTPKENDTPKQAEAKGKYNKSMMSIWDAYRNKDIDKETAGYFTIDAIANLAKNLGRSIGNVGAQFSGGTIDNGHDTSMWEQRRDSMFGTELQKETEEVKTFDNILKGYQTNRVATVNDMLNDFRAKSNDPSLSETEKRFYQVLAVQLAGAGLDGNAQIATIGSGVWDDIKSKFGEWFGKKR